MKSNKPVDIVITWVDGSDPDWLKEFNQYSLLLKGDKSKNRFRDFNFLKYWFRSIEQNALWVRKIHFVTWGHTPDWLNSKHPKLNIVKHSDFIPHKYLPTFNSRVIEFNFHRILGLSDQFIYFNDDMFLMNKRDDIHFFRNNKPIDFPVFERLDYLSDSYLTRYRNSVLIQNNFNRRKMFFNKVSNWVNFNYNITTMIRNIWSIFSYGTVNINSRHLPLNLCKKDFDDLWLKENEYLNQVCSNKFREYNDINPFVVRMWNIHSNNFILPKEKFNNKWVNLNDSFEFNKSQIDIIFGNPHDLICLNDDISNTIIFEQTKGYIIDKFEKKYASKSSFEN